MLSNDAAKLLGIKKSHLRYLRESGVVTPTPDANGYLQYSDEDILRLKRLLVCREAGIPMALLKQVLRGRLTFRDALLETEVMLEDSAAELQRTMDCCAALLNSGCTFETIPVDPGDEGENS